jgi:hypothetical protein
MRSITLLCTLVASLLVGTHALPAATNENFDPSKVYIEELVFAGTGCPQNTAVANFNPSRTTFTILFDQFIAQAGPGIPMAENRKNCVFNVKVHLPSGFQYSIVTVDYRGYTTLDDKVTAAIETSYYFAGSLQQVSVRSPFVGPMTKDYTFRDTLDIATTVWSACGQSENLNANTRIRVDNTRNPKASGILTTDSVDGKVQHVLGLAWRKC